MKVYGLWPVALDRLANRTGKPYSFLVATVAAQSADEARRCATEQDEMSLPWDNPSEFVCKEIATIGDLPPEGRVLYQWTPAY
jgi:hypothetical protein